MLPRPEFHLSLLHPRYWIVWFSFALLAILVNVLPYRALKLIGFGIGTIVKPVLKKRAKIARKNLQMAFPEYCDLRITEILNENFRNTGLALIETGMAWFWPDWRVRSHANIINPDGIHNAGRDKRGVLVICGHFLNLEMTARILSLVTKGYGVYRPNSNPAYEFIQHWGRTRNGHQMIDRKDVRSMINCLKNGGHLWYLPDHDYGKKNSVFVPFFGVNKAATTTGTSFLVDVSRCAAVTASSVRRGNQYELDISMDVSTYLPKKDFVGTAEMVNGLIEEMILKDLTQWMWLHKRFKTTEDGTDNYS